MSSWFRSRRSCVRSMRGMVACSQPLAAQAGIDVMQRGGNAADAAVAVAAALNVTEPCSTGIGGDVFVLYYDAATRKLSGLNGCGRSPAALTPEIVEAAHPTARDRVPTDSVHAVTVPGAAAAWIDCIDAFGSGALSYGDVLRPAIGLAESGFPVSEIASDGWYRNREQLERNAHGSELLLDGHAPKSGEVFRNPGLARTLRLLAEGGKRAFYESEIADEIIRAVTDLGGTMTHHDLATHHSSFEEPIGIELFDDVCVFEMPPPGQGLAALLALNIAKHRGIRQFEASSAEFYHIMVESMRLAFADAHRFVGDPQHVSVPVSHLLSDDYARSRAELIHLHSTIDYIEHGAPEYSSDTVYFCVTDAHGNACSFINSNYTAFGSGIVPRGCGFTLANRGATFTLEAGHANRVGGGKRPYNTIIPGMLMHRDGSVIGPFGVMGGFMQPQGHLQVVMQLVLGQHSPQKVMDLPRFCLKDGDPHGLLLVEEDMDSELLLRLKQLGHRIDVVRGRDRHVFGRGQLIVRDADAGTWTAGSDPRADGQAVPLL